MVALEGHSLNAPPIDVFWDTLNIRMASDKPLCQVTVSIVICTYGRQESLNVTLQSLTQQTFRDFEVILITEKGDLSALRDKGLRSAVGSIVTFIDDDVYCPPTWLQGIINGFREGVVGVSGPTIITEEFRNKRDVFRFRSFKKLHDWAFLGRYRTKPGYLSSCGTPSLASCSPKKEFSSWFDEGELAVDYLEACNMAVRRKEALDVGGFDHHYKRTSEWCEVDLALKMRECGKLIFSRQCLLYHCPSSQGVYTARLSTQHRFENFVYFQRKWIKPSLRRHLYWAFVWTYLKLKDWRMI